MTDKTIPAYKDMRPLRYIIEVLLQIERTVRDFGLDDAAQLLEKARLDIEAALLKQQNDVDG